MKSGLIKHPAISLEDKIPPVKNEGTDGQNTATESQEQGRGVGYPREAKGSVDAPRIQGMTPDFLASLPRLRTGVRES